MTIITNDPFDSIGYGVEWLKALGVPKDDLVAPPLMGACSDFKGDVILVLRRDGKDPFVAVFNEKYPARQAIAFMLANGHRAN